MQAGNPGSDAKKNELEKNAESVMAQAVLKLFNAYYRDHNHSGKLYDDFPDFYMFKAEVLEGKENATRGKCPRQSPSGWATRRRCAGSRTSIRTS